MKNWVGAVLGALLLCIGVVFTLQGVGVLLGSFMTGSKFWLAVGIVCVVLGGWWGIGCLRRLARR